MASDENPQTDELQSGSAGPATAEDQTERGSLPGDVAGAFERMEKLLSQIRGSLDSTAREARYREFSMLRLVGAVLEVFVAGFVILALLDWFFTAPTNKLLVKLAFAAVLQLAALTAFIVSREKQ